MVRLLPQLTDQDWTNIISTTEPIIHYFNEPERAGITPEVASSYWFSHLLPLRTLHGKKLISPSCASDPAGSAWLASFLNLTSSSPPDFLGLHYYGTEAEGAIGYLEEMHGRYPEMKVVVSEIACIAREERKVREFMVRLCNWMDEREWVVEYGFFGCMSEVADGFVSPEAQLMDGKGEFRELMWKYMGEQPMVA
ncbi:hypothetical protein EG329_000650 [Mollisiaceae sp. DMI_Dod_QoI]|nr:hypothetical protein EG329_000650 [Helotiales sp. DMI_Dod_QoI]